MLLEKCPRADLAFEDGGLEQLRIVLGVSPCQLPLAGNRLPEQRRPKPTAAPLREHLAGHVVEPDPILLPGMRDPAERDWIPADLGEDQVPLRLEAGRRAVAVGDAGQAL
jgi:hypothetical protein